jgi:ribosomal protein S18 acetylase RimI-like enzyme/2-polyprenyl-3-methyl-5-hydroxy-6-metoxy-1,4-benzoquinol methylase
MRCIIRAPERNFKITLNNENPQARLFDHTHRLLKTHETLLRDTERNSKFYDALKQRITPGCSVLDIGSGTGIWAITAAKLGAGRVVAVDMDELLVGVIRILANEHGVSDRVDAVCASSLDLSEEREFDVIVSETIGFLGYDELIVEVMADARNRFLRQGGHIIPETIALCAAAGKLKRWTDTIPTGVDLNFDSLMRLNMSSPRVMKRSGDVKLLTRPVRLVSTDLRRELSTPPLGELRAEWDMPFTADVDCVVVWVESRLATGVKLSTRRTTSWRPTIYRISSPSRPFERMEFSLSLTTESNYWTATYINGEIRETSSYSPEFAATEMIAAARGSEVANREGHLLIARAGQRPFSIEVREVTSSDEEFLRDLYHSTRRDEVAEFGWSVAEQDAFLTMQFEMQRKAYDIQYPKAEHRIILFDGTPVGRIITDKTGRVLSLTDISVLPQYRGRGIASRLIAMLKRDTDMIVLNVDKHNTGARQLYEKHGFVSTAETEFKFEMCWSRQNLG